MVTCNSCDTTNPPSNRYCGACGSPLEEAPALNEAAVTEIVRKILKTEFADAKFFEAETAQSIAGRLVEWAKIFTYVVGIPVGVLIFCFSLLGINSMAAFLSVVERGKTEVSAQVATAKRQIVGLNGEGAALGRQYAQLRTRLSDTEQLAVQVETLTKRVDVLGEKLDFTPTSVGTPELRKQLSQAFGDFVRYLHILGYPSNNGKVGIDIENKWDYGSIAFYNPLNNTMFIEQKYAANTAIMLREYMHHVLYQGDRLDKISGYGNSRGWMYTAIELGLATYLPCSFENNPRAIGTQWDLESNRHKVSEITDKQVANTIGTELWGSAFWQMRSILGRVATDKLLYATWLQLRPEDSDSVQAALFVRKLLDQVDAMHRAQVRSIFTSRGISF